jgi:hypothetical protein
MIIDAPKYAPFEDFTMQSFDQVGQVGAFLTTMNHYQSLSTIINHR